MLGYGENGFDGKYLFNILRVFWNVLWVCSEWAWIYLTLHDANKSNGDPLCFEEKWKSKLSQRESGSI